MQGEGNREADRRYRQGARRFAESGRVEDAAREAREAVEDGEDPGERVRPGRLDESDRNDEGDAP